MTEGGAPPRRQVLSPTDGGGVTADLCFECYSSDEPQITDFNGEPQIFSQPPQDPIRALEPHAHVRGDPLPEGSPSPGRLMTQQVTNADVAEQQQQDPNASSHPFARRTKTMKKTLSEKMSTIREKKKETQKHMLQTLKTLISGRKSRRDVINGLHHASSSLQTEHPLFEHLIEYRQETERLEKLKEDESLANRQVSDSDCLKHERQAQLENQIIRQCATPIRQEGKQREEEGEEEAEKDVNVFHIDETGPCGESPVHLAFVLGLSDLGHDCV
jgi:hypothetical protein